MDNFNKQYRQNLAEKLKAMRKAGKGDEARKFLDEEQKGGAFYREAKADHLKEAYELRRQKLKEKLELLKERAEKYGIEIEIKDLKSEKQDDKEKIQDELKQVKEYAEKYGYKIVENSSSENSGSEKKEKDLSDKNGKEKSFSENELSVESIKNIEKIKKDLMEYLKKHFPQASDILFLKRVLDIKRDHLERIKKYMSGNKELLAVWEAEAEAYEEHIAKLSGKDSQNPESKDKKLEGKDKENDKDGVDNVVVVGEGSESDQNKDSKENDKEEKKEDKENKEDEKNEKDEKDKVDNVVIVDKGPENDQNKDDKEDDKDQKGKDKENDKDGVDNIVIVDKGPESDQNDNEKKKDQEEKDKIKELEEKILVLRKRVKELEEKKKKGKNRFFAWVKRHSGKIAALMASIALLTALLSGPRRRKIEKEPDIEKVIPDNHEDGFVVDIEKGDGFTQLFEKMEAIDGSGMVNLTPEHFNEEGKDYFVISQDGKHQLRLYAESEDGEHLVGGKVIKVGDTYHLFTKEHLEELQYSEHGPNNLIDLIKSGGDKGDIIVRNGQLVEDGVGATYVQGGGTYDASHFFHK